MSGTGTETAPVGFLATVEADLKAAEGWIEEEVSSTAVAAWNLVKQLFSSVSAEQAAILSKLADQALKDAGTGASWESVVTDMLNKAEVAELQWITTVPSEVILAFATLLKAKLMPLASIPASGKKG